MNEYLQASTRFEATTDMAAAMPSPPASPSANS